MILGLGSGSTAAILIEEIGKRCQSGELTGIKGVPTSFQASVLAQKFGIPLTTLNEIDHMDLAIDGADEVDPALNLIKGGGACQTREKLVDTRADASWWWSTRPSCGAGGQLALPVEVLADAYRQVQDAFARWVPIRCCAWLCARRVRWSRIKATSSSMPSSQRSRTRLRWSRPSTTSPACSRTACSWSVHEVLVGQRRRRTGGTGDVTVGSLADPRPFRTLFLESNKCSRDDLDGKGRAHEGWIGVVAMRVTVEAEASAEPEAVLGASADVRAFARVIGGTGGSAGAGPGHGVPGDGVRGGRGTGCGGVGPGPAPPGSGVGQTPGGCGGGGVVAVGRGHGAAGRALVTSGGASGGRRRRGSRIGWAGSTRGCGRCG